MTIKIETTTVLETKRCRLRCPERRDIPHIWTATRHKGFNDGMSWNPPASPKDLEEPLNTTLARWKQGSDYTWTIETLVGEIFVGRASIRTHGDDDGNDWSIGFWTHPVHQSLGYATEAAEAIVRLGFEVLYAQKIVAAHALWNDASGAVLRKLGMTCVGKTDRGFMKQGRWVAEYEYEITRAEFASGVA